MNKPLLDIQQLTIGFGAGNQANTVVSQLDVSIVAGQCMALVGESGSGKSMTALAVMQLLPPSGWVQNNSRVMFRGENLLDFSERNMRKVRGLKIGMIFQDAMSAFNPVLTIGQQMNEVLLGHMRLSRRKAKERAFNLLAEVGIDNPKRTFRAYPHQLSGGMRQRAMIAMALCGEPSLIIADEPTTALDVTIQAQVINLLRDLKDKRGLSLLFISHDLAVVSQLADDITVLQRGKVVEQTEIKTFFSHPGHEYSQKLLASIPSTQARLSSAEVENPLLNVTNLKVYFPIRKGLLKRKVGDVKAVDNVSLILNAGETLALVGESGSGKTTTAKAVMRLIESTSGDIVFAGNNLSALPARAIKRLRRDFQIIFQDPYAALNPRRMVVDSIIEGIATQKIIRSRAEQLAKVDELLRQVELSPEYKWRYPHEFSGGERQRICIARALALQPKLLILDEPTSALDVSIQMQVLQLLERLQAQHGLAYLLITHNLSVVAYLSHSLAVMHRGKIVEHGPTKHILQDPQDAYTKRLLASVPRIQEAAGKNEKSGVKPQHTD